MATHRRWLSICSGLLACLALVLGAYAPLAAWAIAGAEEDIASHERSERSERSNESESNRGADDLRECGRLPELAQPTATGTLATLSRARVAEARVQRSAAPPPDAWTRPART